MQEYAMRSLFVRLIVTQTDTDSEPTWGVIRPR
jgi:hypothetical protein